MSSLTRAETASWLQKHDNYLILTHRRPDGDTLGSAAALCRILRQLGKIAYVLQNNEITEKYLHLYEGLAKAVCDEKDTVICVDTASASLLPDAALPLLDRIALRIDHHGSATSFTPFELVDPESAACGDIVYDIMQLMNMHLDKRTAEALYTAVSTDTGCFRYANTNAHSFIVAAACAEAGGDLHRINQAIFDTNSFGRLRLQSWIVENIQFFANGAMAVCALPRQVETELGLTEDDLENVSGFPRSIEGVKLAATLREMEDGQVKVSVRAVPGYDAASVCAHFGGGGHKGAAGATLYMPLADAAQAVAKVMEELF